MADVELSGDWGSFPDLAKKYPELGTGPVPVEPYVSQRHFELERDHIFRKCWLNIGRVEEIPEVGDYLAIDVEIARSAILIVRGEKGEVRGFYNQCSHRSSAIVAPGKGNCSFLKCPMHAWRYTLDGKLRSIPDEKGFYDLDKSELGLTPLATDVWGGFIFINFDPDPAETLEEYLGDWGRMVGDFPFEITGGTMFEWRTELKCNWKIFKDAFQEPFHTSFVHQRTLGGIYANPSNPYGYVIDAMLYPRHHGVSQLGADSPIEPTGLAKVARDYGTALFQHAASLQANPDHVASFTPGTNPQRHPQWDADLHGIFPNTILNTFAGGRFFTNSIWPLSVDRSLWIARAYFPKPRNAGERFSLEYNKILLRDIVTEDGSTVEGVQRAIGSGAKKQIVLHEQEIMVRHDRKVIEEHVGFYRDAEAHHG